MKVYKFDSPIEQKVQQVEKLMNDLGISLRWNGFELEVVEGQKQMGVMRDTDGRDATTCFPRMFESERIILTDSE